MQGGAFHGNDIHNGAQLCCAISYVAQHLQVLRILYLYAWMRFLLAALLLPGILMPLQSHVASPHSHVARADRTPPEHTLCMPLAKPQSTLSEDCLVQDTGADEDLHAEVNVVACAHLWYAIC